MSNYGIYLRVSTQKQGKSMLGIEAQRKMCEDFVLQNNGVIAQEFMDVESGTHRNRKGLQDAIVYCKKNGYPLVIAKLDRLARDVEFCFKVINTGIDIHFCDMPTINTLLLGVFASVAQYERELTSARTKQALAVKKAQGAKLGASNEKYVANQAKKSPKEIDKICKARGASRTKKFLDSPDSQAFLKVIKNVFPDHCVEENPKNWEWKGIRARLKYTEQIIKFMRDYKDVSGGQLFGRWDFDSPLLVRRLRAYLQNFKKAIQK